MRITHDLAVALAKRLEEEGITDEELERIIHDAKEEARQEIARVKGADEVYPIVKGEMRLVGDTTLWIKTDKWEQIGRVIVEDTNSVFGKVFYAEGADDE